ncbi:MAG: archease [Elusimicrobiota bacterium]
MKNKFKDGYRILETTADIGLELRGQNLEKLFENSIKGLTAVICGDRKPKTGGRLKTKKIEIEFSGAYEDLLVDFLNELIFLVNEKLWLPEKGRVDLQEDNLKAEIQGRIVKPKMIDTQIKAATFHNIKIEKNKNYRTKVVFDI